MMMLIMIAFAIKIKKPKLLFDTEDKFDIKRGLFLTIL